MKQSYTLSYSGIHLQIIGNVLYEDCEWNNAATLFKNKKNSFDRKSALLHGIMNVGYITNTFIVQYELT